jgi:hypothetical protein
MANKIKVINNSDKPYEFTFDGGNYGPFAPGEIIDLPAEIANHAVKRSAVVDPDFGDVIDHRMAYLHELTQEQIQKIAVYECPFVMTNQCKVSAFKSSDELRVHMESHWGVSAAPPLQGGKQPAVAGKQ